MMEIARYQVQDASGGTNGVVRGIYYKDIMEKCNMSQKTFYNVLDSLEQKGLIKSTRNNNDYDIIILDNDFSYEGARKEGYININNEVFGEEKFKKLKVNEKILLMLFMRNTYLNKGTYRIGNDTFYEKYTELLGVTEKVLRGYLNSLKKFFNIYKSEGNYFINFLADKFKEKIEKEVDQLRDHTVRILCRRNKVDASSDQAVKDTMQLIVQYQKEAKDKGKDIFDIMGACLEVCRKSILNSKYLHKLIRKALGLPVSNGSII